ncbi:ABC transporter ATP-binding protein [Candidatus Hydrogenedentota bacterium]
MNAVEFREVTKRFGDVLALDNLSMSVAHGGTLCLFGPSGCGKTTALRLIAGLDEPDSGVILIDGEKAGGNGVYMPPVKRRVGMVFQDLALWPHMTVAAHLDFVLRAKCREKDLRRNRIKEILGTFHLYERRGAFPAELSGGQQQRLAIARALAGEPRVLLLDEPFVSLDDELRGVIMEDLIRLRREIGLTVVFASHDRGEVARFADSVLLMHDGNYRLADVGDL